MTVNFALGCTCMKNKNVCHFKKSLNIPGPEYSLHVLIVLCNYSVCLFLPVDFDDTSNTMVNSPSLSSSPPNNMATLDKPKTDFSTPPSSPNVNVATNRYQSAV